MHKITFKIERDGAEFHTWCPELAGCHSHGATVKEAMQKLKDAVQLYLDTIMEEEIAKQSVNFDEAA